MEWLPLVGELLWTVAEAVVWAGDVGGVSSAGHSRPRQSASTDDPPVDAEAIATYVARTSAYETRVAGSFLAPADARDPMWDRDLDG